MPASTQLMTALRDIAGVEVFVETGTYLGQTAAWAANNFARVCTMELSATHADAARRLFADRHNVSVLHGQSERLLPSILATLDRPALFWLDAHWSGPGTDGEEKECPVVQEIAQIEAHDPAHIVLVDDAQYFFRPPPPPHKSSHWPLIGEVFAAFGGDPGSRSIYILGDIIVKIPVGLKAPFEAFLLDDLDGRDA